MQNGTSVNGSVSMILRLTTADGATHYWTSGQTTVAVSSGAFRYPLGTPNESAFAAIDWAKGDAVRGAQRQRHLLTPREPLLPCPLFAPGGRAQARRDVTGAGAPRRDARHGRNRITSVGTPISGTDAAKQSLRRFRNVWLRSVWLRRFVDGIGSSIYNVNAGNVGVGTASPKAKLPCSHHRPHRAPGAWATRRLAPANGRISPTRPH